ncbi:DUF1638 domain-containing protein [Desulforhopalus sp. 52FAK]
MLGKSDNKETSTAMCCGVYKDEILVLKKRYWPNLTINFLSSMLHMRPDLLGEKLSTQLEGKSAQDQKTLLIYGDCCMQMSDLTKSPDVVRVHGHNCIHQILGSREYKRLSHEGVFFLLPEWASRWHHIFKNELGLNEANAEGLMREMHSKLMYLDTGIKPVPIEDLKECSRYCGLPWEVLQVSLEPLRKCIQDAMDELHGSGGLHEL